MCEGTRCKQRHSPYTVEREKTDASAGCSPGVVLLLLLSFARVERIQSRDRPETTVMMRVTFRGMKPNRYSPPFSERSVFPVRDIALTRHSSRGQGCRVAMSSIASERQVGPGTTSSTLHLRFTVDILSPRTSGYSSNNGVKMLLCYVRWRFLSTK